MMLLLMRRIDLRAQTFTIFRLHAERLRVEKKVSMCQPSFFVVLQFFGETLALPFVVDGRIVHHRQIRVFVGRFLFSLVLDRLNLAFHGTRARASVVRRRRRRRW